MSDSSQRDTFYILIVDDDWMNRELLEAYLHMDGYRVEQANDGEKALAMARANPPGLIMLDVHLPGIDGLEVCRRLKSDERTAAIPVMLVTALSSEENKQQADQVGANGFFTKPYNITGMLAQIKALMQGA